MEVGPRENGGRKRVRPNQESPVADDRRSNRESDVNTFKILVSTDNHLGYGEECPIRAEDSFNTFEEVLQLAQKEQVDFVLLGGDLFHKNKPTRRSLFKCINLLRKYSFGNKPCSFEILNGPDQKFEHSRFPWANTEDDNLNIGMPIFSINGNHDDPTGADNLCALDILSASGLINFFGKVSHLDQIDISPLVFRKGSSKLCLFGLSSIRDERLHRMFRAGKVNLLFPETSNQEQDGSEQDWFHLMVLHQNHTQYGQTANIPESFLHPNLNLVVWGHEHQAMDKPQYNPTQDFYVLQPGSTVATSLSAGEADSKNSWIIHIRGDQFKADKVPLQTVRPFVIRDVNLTEEAKIDRNKPKYKEKVNQFCCGVVHEMIQSAKKLHSGNAVQPIDKPLIRLRLHYTADAALTDVTNGSAPDAPLNVTLFGKQFLDQVANARDIVTLHKTSEQEIKDRNALMKNMTSDLRDAMASSNLSSAGVNLHTTVVGLVKQFFQSADQSEQRYKLSVLTETGLSLATREFVEKEEADALYSIVGHQIKKTVDWTVANLKTTPDDEAQFEDEIVKFRKERLLRSHQSRICNATTDVMTADNLDDSEITESQQDALTELEEAKKAHLKHQETVSKVSDVTELIDSDDDKDQVQPYDVMESTRIPGKTARGTRARGRGRGSRVNSKAADSSISTKRGAVSRGPANNNTLNLSKLASSRTQTKLTVVTEVKNDSDSDSGDSSKFLKKSKRIMDHSELRISDDEQLPESQLPESRSAPGLSQNIFSRRFSAIRNPIANSSSSSAVFTPSQQQSSNVSSRKLSRKF